MGGILPAGKDFEMIDHFSHLPLISLVDQVGYLRIFHPDICFSTGKLGL